MNTNLMFSSKTDQWSTPQSFFDELDKEFHFTLDPCADAKNHKCTHYFTIEDNGLNQDWSGERVFCNPPYGRVISKWVKKCYEESCKENTLVVLLIPARTDTAYFHDYIYGKAEIRFIRGRLKFGNAKNAAPFPSMVIVFHGSEKSSKGQLMVLPCKVGDIVWAITSPANVGMESEKVQLAIFECKVESITLYADGAVQFRLYYHGRFVAWYVTTKDFGKTVFLTRKEAEAALEAQRGSEGK